MNEKAPMIDYDYEDMAIRRQRDLRGLKKAKEIESKREYVYVRTDNHTVIMVEKNKYERLYKTKKHEAKSL